jgi:hypothetical protein
MEGHHPLRGLGCGEVGRPVGRAPRKRIEDQAQVAFAGFGREPEFVAACSSARPRVRTRWGLERGRNLRRGNSGGDTPKNRQREQEAD